MTEAQQKLEEWFDEYVPAEGTADTLGGEIVRAVERVAYRWYNDGDMIFHGYGNVTVTPAWRFISKFVPNIDCPEKFDDKPYTEYIEDLCEIVVDYLTEHPEVFEKRNFFDSTEPTKEDERAERMDLDDEYYGDDEY